MKHFLLKTFSCIFILFTLTYCHGLFAARAEDEVPGPAPQFRDSEVILYVGWESYDSFIDNLPEEDVFVSYKSSKKKIASVNSEGIITPKKKGSTTITATISFPDGSIGTCTMLVTVKNPYYEVTSSVQGLAVGESACFKLKRYGYSGEVSWHLEGSQYASIESSSATDCIVTGLSEGKAVLTVESNGVTQSFSLGIYKDGSGTVFILTPKSKPYKNNYTTRSDYNSSTKQYYTVRSYLERLSAIGGGILVFSKGTYKIPCTLCIPSNTTIILEDGAVILKTEDTGTTLLKATGSLFHTVSYSHTTTKFTEYNGEHDIAILGRGTAIIDSNNIQCQCITACHVRNLRIDGITFKNQNKLHFIELDASRDVEITNNYFSDSTPSSVGYKEAINLDTPDKNTKGFSQDWTSYDCTPNLNVCIADNVFCGLEVAIGTHKYTEGKPHTNIQILRNSFIDMSAYCIRVMNWEAPVIKDNFFVSTSGESAGANAVLINGAVNPLITDNYIRGFTTPIICYHWKNSGYGRSYAQIMNDFDDDSLIALKRNYFAGCTKHYIEYYDSLREPDEEQLTVFTIHNAYILE